MAFVAAMDAATAGPTQRRGENGAAELTAAGVGDPAVALFFALVRGISDERVKELMGPLLKSEAGVVAAFVLTFQTRNCRGGKGERDLFRTMFLTLAEAYPETVFALVDLVPEYGSFKDWTLLAAATTTTTTTTTTHESSVTPGLAALSRALTEKYAARLRADDAKLKDGDLSLAAKWAPRENKASSAFAKRVAAALFPGDVAQLAKYRKLVARLNKRLGTVEVKMCGNAWGAIEPTAVPSVCLLKHRKAFLNEKLKAAPTEAEIETGNRRPDDEGRVACRKRVREALLGKAAKQLKGKQLFPHQIVEILQKTRHGIGPSAVELEILDAQWKVLREDVRSKGGFGNVVALVDVSGSMTGVPMHVAVALGILTSECALEAFQNRVLTFHSEPSWFDLSEQSTIAAKVSALLRAPWGMSTDFAKAMDLILDVCVAKKLKAHEVPSLLVLSDMQFDAARGRRDGDEASWETHHARIVRKFHEAGLRETGEPWPAPQMTYWNLRGNTKGFPAKATEDNVRLLSGFSPALLSLVVDGSDDDLPLEEQDNAATTDEDGAPAKKNKAAVDPVVTLARALDDAAYDPVRAILAQSTEGHLKDYTFQPPPDDDATVATRSASVVDDDFVLVDDAA